MVGRAIARTLRAVALVAILAGAAYAFTANNVVDPSNAGDGSNTISGYTVSNVHYDLQVASGYADITGVSFTLSPSNAQTVYARIRGTSGVDTGWASCSFTSGVWTCPLSSVEAGALFVNNLEVVAAQ